jgi:hypothetical protein
MTKQKVIKLAKAQGAKYYEDTNGFGQLEVEIVLPDGKVWDNGYNTGVCTETKDGYATETSKEFWSAVYDYINHPVVEV